MKIALLLALALSHVAHAKDYNQYVLDAVRALPEGGRYSKLEDATIALGKSIFSEKGVIRQSPLVASPVYCSGATWQSFLHVIQRLQSEGAIRLSKEAVDGLLVNMQPDGTDSWGRWNSNGPGTSRLFFELGLGLNTMSFTEARPGDFLKVFFNEHIGRYERGHSVVYLGLVKRAGVEYIKYWSSDAPKGRGVYEMRRTSVVRAIFSRLQNPEALNNIPRMPKTDAYLASMLTQPSTEAEMREKIGL